MSTAEGWRQEIADRLGRRADLYRNAGDLERASRAEDAAGQVLAAASPDEAGRIEASVNAPKRGLWRRFWDRMRGSDDDYGDDS
jgi:hypothetical protein